MLYMTDPKSSVSSLPSFSPVLTHLLGYKLISQHLSFHRCPSARSQTWTDSAPLQPCSFSWAARWAASLEVIATRLRVSPSSSLLYRPEGKEVSPWKRQENGYGGCCQPSLDFFWKVNGWTLGTFLDSQKSVIMCSAFNKNLPPHFAESWTSSLTLSIARLYPVPKNHFRIVKRSIFDTCPGSCPIPPKTLGFYCLSLSNKISLTCSKTFAFNFLLIIFLVKFLLLSALRFISDSVHINFHCLIMYVKKIIMYVSSPLVVSGEAGWCMQFWTTARRTDLFYFPEKIRIQNTAVERAGLSRPWVALWFLAFFCGRRVVPWSHASLFTYKKIIKNDKLGDCDWHVYTTIYKIHC